MAWSPASRAFVVLGAVAGAAALAASPGRAAACSCGGRVPFLEAAAEADLVIVARVLAHGVASAPHPKSRSADTLIVDVTRVIRGPDASGPLTVLGSTGFDCRPSVRAFPVGSTWALAVYRLEPAWGDARHRLGVCGDYGVEVRNGLAVGGITRHPSYGVERLPDGNVLVTNEPEELPLAVLVRRILAGAKKAARANSERSRPSGSSP